MEHDALLSHDPCTSILMLLLANVNVPLIAKSLPCRPELGPVPITVKLKALEGPLPGPGFVTTIGKIPG
jgi:hypothetical protein